MSGLCGRMTRLSAPPMAFLYFAAVAADRPMFSLVTFQSSRPRFPSLSFVAILGRLLLVSDKLLVSDERKEACGEGPFFPPGFFVPPAPMVRLPRSFGGPYLPLQSTASVPNFSRLPPYVSPSKTLKHLARQGSLSASLGLEHPSPQICRDLSRILALDLLELRGSSLFRLVAA